LRGVDTGGSAVSHLTVSQIELLVCDSESSCTHRCNAIIPAERLTSGRHGVCMANLSSTFFKFSTGATLRHVVTHHASWVLEGERALRLRL